MKPQYFFFSILFFITYFFCNSQTTSENKSESKYFLNLELGAGPAFGVGSMSKNSSKSNSLGKLEWGFVNCYRLEGIIKGEYGICLGLDFNYNQVANDSILQAIKTRHQNTKINPTSVDNKVLIAIIRFHLGVSRYYNVTKRLIIQPKIDFSIGYYDYSYFASVAYGNDSYSDYEGSGGKFISVFPSLSIKYLLIRKRRLDLACCLNGSYQNIKVNSIITETNGNVFSKGKTVSTEFLSVNGRTSIVYPTLGLAFIYKRAKRTLPQ